MNLNKKGFLFKLLYSPPPGQAVFVSSFRSVFTPLRDKKESEEEEEISPRRGATIQ
jgi:hypothetical protein